MIARLLVFKTCGSDERELGVGPGKMAETLLFSPTFTSFFRINALRNVSSLWLISRVSNSLIWANSEEQIYGGCHLTILELLTAWLVLFENNSLITFTVSQEGNESR